MIEMGSTLRILKPAPGVLAFYDGRIEGVRACSEKPNWLDDGAYALGIASYAIVEGNEALVYDTHMSLTHARLIRETVEAAGAKHIRVVLSHWHEDHIAGNAVFADCEIIAGQHTAAILREKKAQIETGFPPIAPLVEPNTVFEDRMTLSLGERRIELIEVDVHSRDGVVMWLPAEKLLFAGDIVEDPITYVDEAGRLQIHLDNLAPLNDWGIDRILPNHGLESVIAGGGFGPELIPATEVYVRRLLECRDDEGLAKLELPVFAADLFEQGVIHPWPPYDEVHRKNVAAVCGLA